MRAAILGYGQSGRAVAKYLRATGVPYCIYENETRVDALRQEVPNVPVLALGEPIREGHIYRSPGLRPDLPSITEAVANGSVLDSETETFARLCPAPIYGVTGSDGKTTTATIAQALLAAKGKRVYLGGNIGTCLLPQVGRIAKEDAVVLELSSFQLMTPPQGVYAGVVLNITDNHLDWHHGREEYRLAKENLLRVSRRRVVHASLADMGGVTFSIKSKNANYTLQNGAFCQGDNFLAHQKACPLMGWYHHENLLAAIALTEASGEEVRRALPHLSAPPHRNQYLGTYRGVLCYDASIDTTPSRTAVTLSTHARPLTVICGGRGKDVPLLPLAEALIQYADHVVFTGEEGAAMYQSLISHPTYQGTPNTYLCHAFADAVELALGVTPRGGHLVLSPAATSFDAFSSYVERGEQFLQILGTMC